MIECLGVERCTKAGSFYDIDCSHYSGQNRTLAAANGGTKYYAKKLESYKQHLLYHNWHARAGTWLLKWSFLVLPWSNFSSCFFVP